jgi:sugar porter (SP) family MFS transporter
VVIVATFGGILFGYDTGVVNGALDAMRAEFKLTSVSEGMVTSFLQLGAAVGAATVGCLADRLGRRRMLLYLSWVFMLGTTASALAPDLPVFLAARVALGLAVGGVSVTVPVYLSEMAPTEWRGRISARNEVAVALGQLASFAINAVIALSFSEQRGTWRYMLAVALIPALMLFVGMLRMPESPRWLAAHNQPARALAVLRQIRPPARAVSECLAIEKLANASRIRTVRLLDALRLPWIRRLVWVGIGIAIVQQLTGINAVMFYGTELLRAVGFAGRAAIVANIANGLVSVAGMMVALRIIGRFRRRQMVLFGLAGIALLHLLIALLAATLPAGPVRAVLLMAAVVAFVGVMQACLGLVVWVILGELYPLRVRGAAVGLAALWNWIGNAAVGFGFPTLLGSLGMDGTFLVFGLVNLASFTFVKRFLPETSGRSLEQLETDFSASQTGPSPPGPK